jgi:hypothetical protein
MHRTATAILGVALLGAAPVSGAATLNVPADYATINAALDASTAGDTVLVAPGVYQDYETRSVPGYGTGTAMAFLKDGVVLRSVGGRDVTEFRHDPASTGTAFLAANHASGLTRVEGFSVTGAVQGGGLSAVFSSAITVLDCRFDGVGGIGLFETDLNVESSEFLNCQASVAGGALSAQDGRIILVGCTFRNCSPGAVALFGNQGGPVDYAEIRDCWFEGNSSSLGVGGAVRIQAYSAGAVIDGCTFVGNTSSGSAGGVYLPADVNNPEVRNCVFQANMGNARGGGLYISANGTVTGNTFYGNSLGAPSGDAGTALYLSSSGTTQLDNNVFASTSGAKAIDAVGVTVVSSCNVFWDTPDGIGITPSPTDRIVDPLFCDAPDGDLSLQAGSSCLPANSPGCGLVGALGEGCGAVSVQRMSWGKIKAGFKD